MANHPFRVRKQSSGRTRSITYIVVRNGRRVTTTPHTTRECAQAEADQLNIGAIVRDYDEDARPYEVRRAEAERLYTAQVG